MASSVTAMDRFQTGLDKAVDLLPFMLTQNFLRYAIGTGAVFVLLWVILRPWIGSRKIQPDFPSLRHIRREIGYSLITVLVFALVGFSTVIGSEFGLFKAYGDDAGYGTGYFVFSVVAMLVAHDTYFYWTHRLIHHPKLFRHCHRTHHRSRNPSPFAAYAFDWPEAALNAMFVPLFLLFVPAHYFATFLFLAIMILRNAIGHSGFEIFPHHTLDHPLLKWSTTVTHHDLHHRYNRSNYGLYFSWWDKWMGTEDPAYAATFERATGVADPPGAHAPGPPAQ